MKSDAEGPRPGVARGLALAGALVLCGVLGGCADADVAAVRPSLSTQAFLQQSLSAQGVLPDGQAAPAAAPVPAADVQAQAGTAKPDGAAGGSR